MSLQQDVIKKWAPQLEMTKHIYTKTGDGELCYWAEEASKADYIVEIGTLFGRSAKMMLLANQNAKVWCVDIFEQDGTYETAKYFLRSEIHDLRCFVFRGQSPEGANWVKADLTMLGHQLDLVLVDDGHEEHDVIRDITSFLPLLKSGGLMIGHDLDPGTGVEKAVMRLFGNDYKEPVPRVWAYRKP